MESLNLNVRVDANDKKEFEKFCSRVGMNVSVAVNLFIKAVLRECYFYGHTIKAIIIHKMTLLF